MDYLLLSNWELSKFTYSSEIFNFLKSQVSNTIPSFFLFFIFLLFWVTEFSSSTRTIIYQTVLYITKDIELSEHDLIPQ